MKKLFMSCLLILTACSLTDDKDEKKTPGTSSKDFKHWVYGNWNIASAKGNGSFYVPQATGELSFSYVDTSSTERSINASLYAEINTNQAIYKGADGYYFSVSILNGGRQLFMGNNAYSSLSSVSFSSSSMSLFANFGESASGGGSGGGSGGDDTQDRVPSPYEEDFLRNLKLPYAYRSGDYHFKIEDNGDFVFHDADKGTPYRFYTAKSATSALYRNASKTQYYLFELDASGNLKRSAASGTQNTGSTTIFAFRNDTQFDIIFTDTLNGRYNSPIGETDYKENRIFTADTSGTFRIANDPYQLIRVISKTQAVYKRFNLYYGLSLSNSRIWLSDSARGVSSANNVSHTNYHTTALALPYSGSEADTPNLLTGTTDREKYLQNVSGKNLYLTVIYSEGIGLGSYFTDGYFTVQSSGEFRFHQVDKKSPPVFSKIQVFSLSYVISPISAQYGSTNFILDPFGNLNFSKSFDGTFYYTPRDYETEYRNSAPGTGDKSELIVAGQSYYLIRVLTPPSSRVGGSAIYQKLSDGKYYGIYNYKSVTPGFNSPNEVTGRVFQ